MKKKFSLKKTIVVIIIIISSIILIISSIKLIKYMIDFNNTKDEINNTENITDIKEVEDDDNTEIIESNDDINNPYWSFIKMKLLDIDVSKLKEENSDTVGWIQVLNTNINYPVVQTSDNDYYLTHSFYKNKNDAGWIFLDYRNDINNLNQNTIIYGHGRWDKTMFGTLKNILTNGWLNDNQNFVVRMVTENESTMWQVFSVYRIPTTNDYLQIDFNNDFNEFSNLLISRSQYNFNTSVNENDKILTLSTCYNDNEKVVLHAKLIKRATKK